MCSTPKKQAKSEAKKTKKSAAVPVTYADSQYHFRDLHSNREIYEDCCAKLEHPELMTTNREFYLSRKEYYEAHPELLDRPVEFEKQVEIDVDYVVKKRLNKGVEGFRSKMVRAAEHQKISIAWISQKCSYSFQRFYDFYTDSPNNIPKKLLREVCLLCKIDPYRLLELDQAPAVDPSDIPMIKPLAVYDPAIDNLPHYILESLCIPDDPEKLLKLQLITKIARFKHEKYGIFHYMVDNIPLISNFLKQEPPSVSNLQPFRWMSSRHRFNNEAVADIDEAFSRLTFLRKHDCERLILLTKLANADDTVWSILHAILVTGGFPASANSLMP